MAAAAKKCSQALLMQLPSSWASIRGRMSRRVRESESPQRYGDRKLRNYFKLLGGLFFRPLKPLAPEYTPATSKGKLSNGRFPRIFQPASRFRISLSRPLLECLHRVCLEDPP